MAEEVGSSTNPSSIPQRLTVVGTTLFFTADDGLCGRELWMFERSGGESDLSGGCQLADDIIPGPQSSNPEELTNCGERLYFLTAQPSGNVCRLFCYEPQVKQVLPIEGETPGFMWTQFCIPSLLNGKATFRAGPERNKNSLWAVAPGTTFATMILDYSDFGFVEDSRGLTVFNENLFYWAYDGLRVTDGTVDGTRLLRECPRTSGINGVPLGSRLLFPGISREQGVEPWISDGTQEGTCMLRDIRPGVVTSLSGSFHAHDGTAFFAADDGVHGFELWKTDGTPEGTQLVKDINPGSIAGDPHYFCSFGDWVYFAATDTGHGLELWRTDGTEANTGLVAEMQPGAPGTDIWSLCVFEGRLYFCANSPEYGEEIFSTDGSPDGVRILRDIVPGTRSSGPANLTVMGQTLFFTCDDGVHGEELWMSDGTEMGTRLAADIALPRYNPSSSPRRLTALGGRVVFTVSDHEHGEEIWRSDGSEEGTTILKDIVEGTEGSSPEELTAVRNRVFFTARQAATGRELWSTDGAAENTLCVRDINPGAGDSAPGLLTSFDNSLYFIAGDGVRGRELWLSDGTEAGTIPVTDIGEAENDAGIVDVFTIGSRLYLYAINKDHGLSLWRVDGSDVSPLGPVPRFCSFEDIRGDSTMPDDLHLAPFIRPCNQTGRRMQPAILGPHVYFSGRSQASGSELWRSDGTLTGTQLVFDALPGPSSSSPSHLCVINDTLYFVADSPRETRCLWRSDGTKSGTHVLRPLWGAVRPTLQVDDMIRFGKEQDRLMLSMKFPRTDGQLGSNILGVVQSSPEGETCYVVNGHPLGYLKKPCRFDELTGADDQAFYVVDDGVHGRELWVNNGQPNVLGPNNTDAHMVKDILLPADIRAGCR